VTDKLGFIHRFIPGNTEKTLLLLHGTGGDEEDLIELGQHISPQDSILSPRGKVLEQGMPRFFRRIAEGVFDQEDLQHRTDELATFIKEAAIEYSFDINQVIAVGYSNGANIAASLLLRNPKLLAGAILFHPMPPFIPDILPQMDVFPIFISGGRLDRIIPPTQTEQLIELLRQCGAEVTEFWYPGTHALTMAEANAAQQWHIQNFSQG
jgi:predicted esterase